MSALANCAKLAVIMTFTPPIHKLTPDILGAQLIEAATQKDDVRVLNLAAAGAPLEQRDREGNTALILAASWGKPHIIQALLDAGADINAFNDNKYTSLHKAVVARDKKSVILLLSAKADPNIAQFSGFTPLISATSKDDDGMAQILLDAGADMHQMDNQGRDAIHWAIHFKERNNNMADLFKAFEQEQSAHKKWVDQGTPLKQPIKLMPKIKINQPRPK